MLRRRRSAALVFAAALLLAACGGGEDDGASGDGGSATKADATVKLEPTTFEPEMVKISAGQTVKWVWAGGVQHDVKGPDFDSGVKAKGEFVHTFPTAGTFPIICTVHPATMKGTVEVT